jgi:hypothetical protein
MTPSRQSIIMEELAARRKKKKRGDERIGGRKREVTKMGLKNFQILK